MRVLGIDFGDSRTGYAVSDPLGFGVTTLDPFKSNGMRKVAEHTLALVKEYNAEKIVLGFPKNMDGSVGPRGEKTKALKKMLEEILDIPIILQDERLTTVSAHMLMNETNVRGEKRKSKVDSVSAAYILQAYLDSNKN